MNKPTPAPVFAWALMMCLPALPGIAAAQAHQHHAMQSQAPAAVAPPHNPAPTTMASPTTTSAPLLTKPLLYPSAFGNYQPYADQPVQDWRKANATVNDVGGWRAYAKEIAEGVQSESADGQAATNPHAGHHMGAKP